MAWLAQRFQFPTDIKEVAVIGAGISGTTSAAHLLRQGLSVTVFERSSVAGGVWHYDSRVATEPQYPNVRPQRPENQARNGPINGCGPSESRSFDEISLAHAPPGSCYKGLRNNVPTPLMRSTLMDWPEGTPDYVRHDVVEKYIQDLAVHTGARDRILSDTSVEGVSKSADSGRKWSVRARTLQRVGETDYELVDREFRFDAVVVASGHYQEPRIPDLPGLKEWKARLPDNVMHSKSYRSPESLRGRTVFLIGAGVSALDIAKECEGIAKKTYQSTRNGQFDIPASMLPPGVKRVGPVERLVLKEGANAGDVMLQDGQVVHDIDVVILATGYITSYPFLGRLQAPFVPAEAGDKEIIITSDGCMTHNLHKDIFYIPDPTLVFVGVLYHGSAFSLYDFQAEVVARVLAGKAELPSQERMRDEYEKRRAGLAARCAAFHSVMKKDVQYMSGILDWVNGDAVRLGHERMIGVDARWLEKYDSFIAELQRLGLADRGEDQDAPLVGEGTKAIVGAVNA